MVRLDHLTLIAPDLQEGVNHLRDCLDIDVPFGCRHEYFGTHNHRLQLGNSIYLEVIAIDPNGTTPPRARWFGLDDEKLVRKHWDDGRRLRGWVASTADINNSMSKHRTLFGDIVKLPFDAPEFEFSIPQDGSLPLDGAVPSLIDHKGFPTLMSQIPDLGAHLDAFIIEHPDPATISTILNDLEVISPPILIEGSNQRMRAVISTPTGKKELT